MDAQVSENNNHFENKLPDVNINGN